MALHLSVCLCLCLFVCFCVCDVIHLVSCIPQDEMVVFAGDMNGHIGSSNVEGPRPRGRPKRTWREVVRQDCQARKLNKEDAMDRCKWRKMIKDVRWSGWVWVGECFFWYRPTRVVPDKRPLNGCVCLCLCLSQDNILLKGMYGWSWFLSWSLWIFV